MSEKELFRLSENRFKVMEKIKLSESQIDTIESRWEKVLAIWNLAIEAGLLPSEKTDVLTVRARWDKLKTKHAAF